MANCNHTMFVMKDGSVKGCGLNAKGGLGLGNTDNQSNLVDILVSNVKQVANGDAHTIFLMKDGSVKGCGWNTSGQLGVGSITNQLSLVDIPITNVIQVTCGNNITMFLMQDGTVKGCGHNGRGQLGIGNTIRQTIPIDINISNVKQVACGNLYTIFLMKDGNVKGCGYNGFGQLGIGNTIQQTSPVDIPISNVKQIACGDKHTIFLMNDGTIKACGLNSYGQLGIGDTTQKLSPVNVSLFNVKQVACGSNHTMFVMKDGTVKGCGNNICGQLGVEPVSKQLSPVDIDISNIKQIVCGRTHTIFLMQGGNVKGCGLNDKGQLGIGNTDNQSSPVNIPISNVKQCIEKICFLPPDIFLTTPKNNISINLNNNVNILGNIESDEEQIKIKSKIDLFNPDGTFIKNLKPEAALVSSPIEIKETYSPNQDIFDNVIVITATDENDIVTTKKISFIDHHKSLDFDVSNINFKKGEKIQVKTEDNKGYSGITTINPVLAKGIIETPTLSPTSIHADSTKLTANLQSEKGQIQYRVLNGENELTPPTELQLAPVSLDLTYPANNFTIGDNDIILEVINESGEKIQKTFTLTKNNNLPTVNQIDEETPIVENLTVKAKLEDIDNDDLCYRILVNGKEVLTWTNVKNGEVIKKVFGFKDIRKTNLSKNSVNAIPIMTSNTSPEGIASASSIFDDRYLPYKAFDSTLEAYYGWFTKYGITTGWLCYEFPKRICIDGYSIQMRTGKYMDKGEAPKNWTFEGWNGDKWVTLDTQTDQTNWSAEEKRTYSFGSNYFYKKYRINITKNNGASIVGFGEMEMYGNLNSLIIEVKDICGDITKYEQPFALTENDAIIIIDNKEIITPKDTPVDFGFSIKAPFYTSDVTVDKTGTLTGTSDEGKIYSIPIDRTVWSKINSVKRL